MEDNVIDRALDAAEARLSAETEVETESTETTHETSVENALEDIAVKEELDKPSGKIRDASGKFTKAQKEEATEQESKTPVAEVEAVEGEQQEEEPSQEQTFEAPAFWDAEEKQAYAKAPPELKAVILRKEAQRNEWANRIANEAARSKEYEKRAAETFEPYRTKLQAHGIKDEIEAASRLLAWNELLTQDVKGFCLEQLKRAGFSPYDLIQAHESQPPVDPRVEEAMRVAEEAKRKADEYEQYINEQKSSAFRSQVEAFKDGKDSHGQVRRQFATMYAPQISQAFNEIQAQVPELPMNEALNHAYEYVLSEVRRVHGASAPKPAPVPAQKAVRAAGSVVGAPSSGTNAPKPRAKTVDEALDRAFARAGV